MYSAYWRRAPHYDSPACFSCSIVSFEGSGFFSCVSVFFNFDLSNFSISAISGLSDMVAEDAERGASERNPVYAVAARSRYRPPPFPAQGGNKSRHVNSSGSRSLGSRSRSGPPPRPPSPAQACAPARPPAQPARARGIVRWNTAPSSPRRGGKTPWCSPSKAWSPSPLLRSLVDVISSRPFSAVSEPSMLASPAPPLSSPRIRRKPTPLLSRICSSVSSTSFIRSQGPACSQR